MANQGTNPFEDSFENNNSNIGSIRTAIGTNPFEDNDTQNNIGGGGGGGGGGHAAGAGCLCVPRGGRGDVRALCIARCAPPEPQINIPAWVFRMSWCADLEFRVSAGPAVHWARHAVSEVQQRLAATVWHTTAPHPTPHPYNLPRHLHEVSPRFEAFARLFPARTARAVFSEK